MAAFFERHPLLEIEQAPRISGLARTAGGRA
jgi:hypothetical protein